MSAGLGRKRIKVLRKLLIAESSVVDNLQSSAEADGVKQERGHALAVPIHAIVVIVIVSSVIVNPNHIVLRCESCDLF